MKTLILVVLIFVVIGWLGCMAGHWMDRKAIEVNRPYLEEMVR